jgi:flavin reductase (DIM6/NTAB) family NADH-FMN oxidoreductase RutF
VLEAVHAVLLCRVVDRVPAGDHAIVLAELIDGGHADDATEPLLYHMGRYRRAA